MWFWIEEIMHVGILETFPKKQKSSQADFGLNASKCRPINGHSRNYYTVLISLVTFTSLPQLMTFFCKHSGNPCKTWVMSIPFVKFQACWKYSSRRCLRGSGIWWNLINSRTLFIWAWYRAVPEYKR